MNKFHYRIVSCLFVGVLMVTAAPSPLMSQVVPSVVVEDATIYEVADQCPPDTQALYDQAVQEVMTAMDNGDISDDQLFTYLIENEDLLSQDYEALAEAVFAVTIEEEPDAAEIFGFLKAGGVVSGTRWSFKNVFGWEVGSGRVDVSWNNNANACHSKISGHTFSGSIPLGSCSSAQVGAKFTRNCSPTPACESRTQECGNFQVRCTQRLLFCRLTSFSTRLETICAPCP